MRFLLPTLVLVIAPTLARANDVTASAQATTGYATPQAALVPQADLGTGCAASALAAPGGCSYAVPAQAIIVQRQVVPQAVYVQPQAVVVQRQVVYTPVVQRQFVTSYAPQALASVNSYSTVGAQNAVVVNRAPIIQRGRGLFGGRGKTVTKSRAVVKQR